MIINQHAYTQADYKQHRAAIATWGEYISLERKRGKNDKDIRGVILKSGIDTRTADIIFSAADSGVNFKTKTPRKPIHLVYAVVLIVVGLAVLFVGLAFDRIVWLGPALFVSGFGWIGKYFVIDE
jgi:hypothetical protein